MRAGEAETGIPSLTPSSISSCPRNLLRLSGTDYTPRELTDKLNKNLDVLNLNGGGVTFSGGEPLLQKEFLLEIIGKCKAEGVNAAVETSLFIYDEAVFRSLDLVMADLKIWDNETHRQYTGVPSDVIKENFSRLNRLGVPIIARTPVIPEIEQGIPEISEFLSGLKSVIKYELLPYHPLGESKRVALGLEPSEFTVPTKEHMKELSQYVFIRK